MIAKRLISGLVIKHKTEAVKNIKQSLALLNHMKKFGTVTTFKFLRDPLTRERTGMAYVNYLHYDDAQKALSQAKQIVDGLPEPFSTVVVSEYIQKTTQSKDQ
ncbi:hypothetical protein BX070DRAFT_220042 [Coemansia spiralis]|nr:hypothetical protein BX070DRAFT_220042 [Coemansia spiralis]